MIPITGERFEVFHSISYKKWEQMLINRHGRQDLALARKKVRNFNYDLEQFNRYKKVSEDGDMFKTLDDFQNIKCGNADQYEALLKKYRRLFNKTG